MKTSSHFVKLISLNLVTGYFSVIIIPFFVILNHERSNEVMIPRSFHSYYSMSVDYSTIDCRNHPRPHPYLRSYSAQWSLSSVWRRFRTPPPERKSWFPRRMRCGQRPPWVFYDYIACRCVHSLCDRRWCNYVLRYIRLICLRAWDPVLAALRSCSHNPSASATHWFCILLSTARMTAWMIANSPSLLW